MFQSLPGFTSSPFLLIKLIFPVNFSKKLFLISKSNILSNNSSIIIPNQIHLNNLLFSNNTRNSAAFSTLPAQHSSPILIFRNHQFIDYHSRLESNIFIAKDFTQSLYMLSRSISPQQIKTANMAYNAGRITSPKFQPAPLNLKLASNPFLKDQQKYQYLLHRLKQYNKLIEKGVVTDSYEAMVYEKLFSMFSMLSSLQNKTIQIQRLDELVDWYENETKMILQRKDQGQIRYKTLLKKSDGTENEDAETKKQTDKGQEKNVGELPSDKMVKQALPFKMNWRTIHKELEVPPKRLKQYKRKQLNVISFTSQSISQKAKGPRITYPKPQKIVYPKEYILDEMNEAQQQLNNDQPADQPENADQAVQNPEQLSNKKQQEQQNNDLGLGLGEEPGEDQEEEQEQKQQDKLAPRLKPFIHEPQKPSASQKQSYKSMENKYLQIQEKNVKKKIEEQNIVNLMHQWAQRKSSLNRQVHRRIDNMSINMRYSLCHQEPDPIERINPEDEKRLGFSDLYQSEKKRTMALDLSKDFELPSIKNKSTLYEKSIKNDKLKNLKKKFGKLLNISENQPRDEISDSMCQYTIKKKGFSQILRRNSKSKQRLNQLDEALYLKQKLARSKANVDIKSLSMALAVPEDEELQPTDGTVPRQLPSNPFWVEPKKGKKKKK